MQRCVTFCYQIFGLLVKKLLVPKLLILKLGGGKATGSEAAGAEAVVSETDGSVGVKVHDGEAARAGAAGV
jgi:hypothetical protein